MHAAASVALGSKWTCGNAALVLARNALPWAPAITPDDCCQPFQDIRVRCSERPSADTEGGELPFAATAYCSHQLGPLSRGSPIRKGFRQYPLPLSVMLHAVAEHSMLRIAP